MDSNYDLGTYELNRAWKDTGEVKNFNCDPSRYVEALQKSTDDEIMDILREIITEKEQHDGTDNTTDRPSEVCPEEGAPTTGA